MTRPIKVGDLVEHRFLDFLDWRRVTRIEGDELWLAVGRSEIGPLPVGTYRVVGGTR
jgi:hypothetical protein